MARSTQDAMLAAAVLGAGALLPLQALINARLGAKLSSPLWAAAGQNFVGVLAMLCVIALMRPATPTFGQVGATPLWAWAGGAMGMVYVFSVLIAAPQLGAARAMTAAVVGQLLCAMLLDHFGVLHERRPISLTTVAGVALLVGGAALILRRA
jgi:transporter family-2 protein